MLPGGPWDAPTSWRRCAWLRRCNPDRQSGRNSTRTNRCPLSPRVFTTGLMGTVVSMLNDPSASSTMALILFRSAFPAHEITPASVGHAPVRNGAISPPRNTCVPSSTAGW